MPYDPTRHHRRSIRLPGYDYTQPGAYFVTICTQNRECVFGEVADGEMMSSGAGQMVERIWNELPHHYPGVEVDAFAVMPNHVHGIIVLVVAANTGGRATTGGCPYDGDVVAGCRPSIQISDHGQISPRGSPRRVATVPRAVVAAQLLR